MKAICVKYSVVQTSWKAQFARREGPDAKGENHEIEKYPPNTSCRFSYLRENKLRILDYFLGNFKEGQQSMIRNTGFMTRDL